MSIKKKYFKNGLEHIYEVITCALCGKNLEVLVPKHVAKEGVIIYAHCPYCNAITRIKIYTDKDGKRESSLFADK